MHSNIVMASKQNRGLPADDLGWTKQPLASAWKLMTRILEHLKCFSRSAASPAGFLVICLTTRIPKAFSIEAASSPVTQASCQPYLAGCCYAGRQGKAQQVLHSVQCQANVSLLQILRLHMHAATYYSRVSLCLASFHQFAYCNTLLVF